MWMFDCGEGAQHQILRSPLKLSKLEKLFVSHLHGDHIFGIPGLLAGRSFQGGTKPLTIYGPVGIRRFVETALEVSGTHLPYELNIEKIADGAMIKLKGLMITIAELEHGIPSFGFRVVERDFPGQLQADALQALGISPGPIYKKIKRGETVRLQDGRTIDGRDFLGPPKRGRIVTVLGDTRYCDAAVRLSQNADVLVHEATYGERESELAAQYFHSTAVQAATTADRANVSKLILTHISPRYAGEGAHLLEEARQIFSQTILASDFWSYTVSR